MSRSGDKTVGCCSRKIRILFVLNSCKRCGPTQVVYNIIRNLDYTRYEPVLLTLRDEPDDSKLNDFMSFLKKHTICKVSRFDIFFGKLDSLKREIEMIDADVIHSTGVFPDFAISRISSTNQVITMHNYAPVNYIDSFGKIRGKILVKMQYSAARRAAKTVACSKNLATLYCPKLQLGYVRNGVDTNEYNVVKDRCSLRDKLNLDKHAFIFIYTGHLSKSKNVDYVLDSFNRLYGDNNGVILVLLGWGSEGDALKQKYRSCKNILFFGRVSNVSDYLMASDAYVSASKTEGMPNGVLEAISCGLPVLLSNIPQHMEVLEVGKKCGYSFSIKDQGEELRQAMKSIVHNHGVLSSNARETAVKYFSSEKMSKNYQKVYSDIAPKPCFLVNRENDVKYSIIVPAYNAERYISRCLDSLVGQADYGIEIIVVNDGSTDGTKSVLEKYQKKYKTIRVYSQKNMGLMEARRVGIEKAKGEYCMNVDADDWLEENALLKIDEHIKRNEYVDIVKFKFIYEPSGRISADYDYPYKVLGCREKRSLRSDLLLTTKYNSLCNQVFKRELYKNVNNLGEKRINYGEDIIVNLDIIGRANNILLLNDPLYHYSENNNSITHNISIDKIASNVKDCITVCRERINHIEVFGVKEDCKTAIKNRLLCLVGTQIRVYIIRGGKINDDFWKEIEKTGIIGYIGNDSRVEVSGIDGCIGKCVLRKDSKRLKMLVPYVKIRSKVRSAYSVFMCMKRRIKNR